MYDDVDSAAPQPEEAPRQRAGSGSAMLAAAMLAIGEIVEPHKIDVHIEAEASEDGADEPWTLDFGDLPPLS